VWALDGEIAVALLTGTMANATHATPVQSYTGPTYASVLRLMSDSAYPLNRPKVQEPKPVTIWITDDEKGETQLIADLWNAFDIARGTKQGRKWERKSVLQQLVRTGIKEFWKQIGGKPPTSQLQARVIRAAIAKLESGQQSEEPAKPATQSKRKK
jgi:hypothetical protein